VASEEDPLLLPITEIFMETKWEVVEVQEHQVLLIKVILLETKWEVVEVQEHQVLLIKVILLETKWEVVEVQKNLQKRKDLQSFLQDTYKKLKI
jgi:hypothetical protein